MASKKNTIYTHTHACARYRAGAGSQAHNQETSTHNLPTIKHSHSTRFDVPRALRVPPPEETGNSSKEVYARIQWRKASSKRGAYGPWKGTFYGHPPRYTRARILEQTWKRLVDGRSTFQSRRHRKSINGLRRGNVVRRYTFTRTTIISPFLDGREILFWRIFLGLLSYAPLLLLAPLARNTIVLLYDLRRGLGKLPTYFFPSLPSISSFSPFLSFFPVFRISSFYCRRTACWNFDRFPIEPGFINKRDFSDDRTNSLVSRGSLLHPSSSSLE